MRKTPEPYGKTNIFEAARKVALRLAKIERASLPTGPTAMDLKSRRALCTLRHAATAWILAGGTDLRTASVQFSGHFDAATTLLAPE